MRTRRLLSVARHVCSCRDTPCAAAAAGEQPTLRQLPNAEHGSEISSVPVFFGKPTREAAEASLAEHGFALFRPGSASVGGVGSAEDFGELRSQLFGDMEMQSYKTGVVARESFTAEVLGVTDTIPHTMIFPYHSEMACETRTALSISPHSTRL